MNEKSPLPTASDLSPERLPIIPQARLDAFMADTPAEAKRRAGWEERWKNAPIDARGYFDLRDPKDIEAARARGDARDRADQALEAHLAAAPKLWCVAHGLHEQWVLAIYDTEGAARADLQWYEHLDGVEVTPFPYFASPVPGVGFAIGTTGGIGGPVLDGPRLTDKGGQS